MSTVLELVRAALKLAPAARDAIVTLVRALGEEDDPEAARKAFEAALRLQFIARQKGVVRK